ncbi:MAG: YqjD family protein [Candidatus Aquirickettsiella gammari]
MAKNKFNSSYQAVTQDFNELVKDAQMLFEEATTLTGEKANEAIKRGMELLEVARKKLYEAQNSVINSAKEASDCTEVYVKENPWRAIGTAAGVGLVIGLFIGRRR